jgi:glycerol-3-phosphate dehydrogenase
MSTVSYDLIIIGAGINGAGIARDAAMRGLNVLLLDKGDIASGTTSWSTRLIHGGLRYLEHGEVRLVRESLRERSTLLRIAPHLVKPLPLLIPVYESNRRGPFLIRAGMVAYDLLSIDKTLEHHHFLSREQALARTPGLQPVGLRAAALYFDAQVEFPERLTLENVISAADYGAEVRTYTRVERVMADGGAVRGVELSDVISGERSLAYAPVVFNVAGPWVDELAASSDQSAARLIGGTKGSHIVVAPFHGAPVTALYVEAEKDRRPLFIIPWNNLYLIGTTDERFDDDPDCAVATNAEVEYLIRETNRIIPDARLSFDSVLYSYAGVRPLPFTEAGDPRGITRRHFIRKAELKGFYSVIGGKLTTYRSLAE